MGCCRCCCCFLLDYLVSSCFNYYCSFQFEINYSPTELSVYWDAFAKSFESVHKCAVELVQEYSLQCVNEPAVIMKMMIQMCSLFSYIKQWICDVVSGNWKCDEIWNSYTCKAPNSTVPNQPLHPIQAIDYITRTMSSILNDNQAVVFYFRIKLPWSQGNRKNLLLNVVIEALQRYNYA